MDNEEEEDTVTEVKMGRIPDYNTAVL